MKNKRMKIARMEVDMKQEDLAKAVGVTRQTISLIESGEYNPTLNLCIAICKELNKTLNDLFWEESK
ncbi:MAG: helix-turn-helix transcriptional regulator [Clostridia bacterium]|jgi:putative transcriptional regulator